MTDLQTVSADDFDPYKDSIFTIVVGEEMVESTLIDVVARKGDTVEGAQRGPFSVLFRVAGDGELEQQIYRLEHESMGSLDLFLVPVGPDSEGMRYEAIFS